MADVREALEVRAAELKALPPGWDGYQGERIDPAIVDKAVELAVALAPSFPDYPPALVPGSDGDVQIEFHVDGWDVECWITRA